MNKYLPSKKFGYLIIGFVILGIVFIIFFNLTNQKKLSFFTNKENGLVNKGETINSSLQTDTDGDGVMDWEETLWGTNKENGATFDGIPDLTYIENKKKELNIDTTTNTENLTETEKFAREFFATYVAMKTSGSDASTINNFSNALGEKITYPSLIDSYVEKNIIIDQNDTDASKLAYYANLKKLFEAYKTKGIGEELSIVANGLTSQEASTNYSKLNTIAAAYQDFAKKIMALSVPQSLVQNHLVIANSSNNTGISVLNMTKIITDPIIGLSGLSQYQKYSDEFVKSVQELEAKLPE